MRTCKTCELELPFDKFYTVKQKKGNSTYRKECKDCFNNKEKNRYYIKVQRKGIYRIAYCIKCNEWKIKSQHFEFDESKCNSCIKLETIVEPLIQIEEEHTQEDQSPEFTPLELQPVPLYKTCSKCGEEKDKNTGFYTKAGTVCKECTKERERINRHKHYQERNETYGGSERIKNNVNEWTDEYQRKHVFTVLQAIGWKFNEENNIWYDDKIKTKDGVFINVVPPPVEPKDKKKFIFSFTDKLKEIRFNNIDDMVKLYDNGHTYKQIAIKYRLSRPTITKWIKEYKRDK